MHTNIEIAQASLPQNRSLKLTPRGYHAVMALVELAGQKSENPVPLAEIAVAGKISLSYLEQLFAGLRRNGLVKSARGPGGGYKLAKAPTDITVADIFIAAEDSVPGKRMQGRNQNEAAGSNNAATRHLWDHIGQTLYADLSGHTLDDVLRQNLAPRI
ncbi:MAG: Rrf2 family transcriptional regulator [Micavibrio sp.]